MPTLRRLLAAAGFGMAKVQILVDEPEHPRGSTVTGLVEIEGGIAPQRAQSVVLKLSSYRPSGKTTEVREHAQILAARSLDLVPRQKHRLPFQFSIPDDAFLTVVAWKSPTSGCRIDADVDIAFAANPRSSLPLNVTVHREIQAVQSAMGRLGFSEKRAPALILKQPPHTQVVAHYRPPQALEDQLDGAVLTLEAGSLFVTGTLDLDPRETTLSEKMRALVLTRYQVFPLEFDRGALLTPDGRPNPEAVIPRLQEILAESLVLPDNENMRLLRPAATPAGDSLLRPAAGGSRSRPETLLHPVEGTEYEDGRGSDRSEPRP